MLRPLILSALYFGTATLAFAAAPAATVETRLYNEATGSWDLVRATEFPAPAESPPPAPEAAPASDGVFEKIGAFLFELISQNRIVGDLSLKNANVLPKGLSRPADLSGWSPVRGTAVKKTYYDGLRTTVAEFTYYVSFHARGASRSGAGAYLANLQVVPSAIDVATLFELNASADISDPVNLGSSSSPVAGVNLRVRSRIKDQLLRWEKEETDEWRISGDGSIELASEGAASERSFEAGMRALVNSHKTLKAQMSMLPDELKATGGLCLDLTLMDFFRNYAAVMKTTSLQLSMMAIDEIKRYFSQVDCSIRQEDAVRARHSTFLEDQIFRRRLSGAWPASDPDRLTFSAGDYHAAEFVQNLQECGKIDFLREMDAIVPEPDIRGADSVRLRQMEWKSSSAGGLEYDWVDTDATCGMAI